MDWINKSSNYRYLKLIQKNILPNTIGKQKLLNAIEWAVQTVEEQGFALNRIDEAYNSDEIKEITAELHKPKLKLIIGGKS